MYGQDVPRGKTQSTTGKKNLTTEEKNQRAEELLHNAQLASLNGAAFSEVDSLYLSALSFAPKKGSIASSIHANRSSMLTFRAASDEVDAKTQVKLDKLAFEEAKKAYKADSTNLLGVYFYYGMKAESIKKVDKQAAAKKAYQDKILASDAVTFDDYIAKAYVAQVVSGYDDAIRIMREATKLVQFKTDFRVWEHLAGLLADQEEDHDATIFAYRKALECEPRYLKAHTKIGAELYFEGKKILRSKSGRPDEKYSEAETSLKLARKLMLASEMGEDQETLEWICEVLGNQGKLDELSDLSSIGIALFPNSVCFYDNAAFAIIEMCLEGRTAGTERLDEALLYSDKILSLKPNVVMHIVQKANVLLFLNLNQEALQLINESYSLMQKTKSAQDDYASLDPDARDFVDRMLNPTRQAIVDQLNGLERERVDESAYVGKEDYEKEAAQQINVNITRAEKAKFKVLTSKDDANVEAGSRDMNWSAAVEEYALRTKNLEVKFMAMKAYDTKAGQFLHAVCTTICASYKTALDVASPNQEVHAKSALSSVATFANFIPYFGGVIAEAGKALSQEYSDRKLKAKFGAISHYFSTTKECSLFAESFALQLFEAQREAVLTYEPPKQGAFAKFGAKLKQIVKGQDYVHTTPVALYGHVQATKIIEAMSLYGGKKCTLQPEPGLDLDIRSCKFIMEDSECKTPDSAFEYMTAVLGGVGQIIDSLT